MLYNNPSRTLRSKSYNIIVVPRHQSFFHLWTLIVEQIALSFEECHIAATGNTEAGSIAAIR